MPRRKEHLPFSQIFTNHGLVESIRGEQESGDILGGFTQNEPRFY